ncbi:NUDIX hydrolase [Penicillium chermesinum]|uniref:NUDIX hydrolase n=1 Tax=Penicillium chermesinum TaxID=63820 RepID=A0A9W9NBR8_9EURO|nr:NUDIX hydrolase [Penicillium chermesinum]KAJ5216956.1 NUDIX hydrolase [Penicillium chermesinum]KAJ6171430.1 NUDIX hydrolase [Penicillium chermesinum]
MEPRVGVGVFVINPEGKFVIGKRQGSHGAGTWALPGGHLEFNETFEACAERELLEETGLSVQNLEFLTATNNIMLPENKHYVTVFMKGAVTDSSAQPQLLEPEKCTEWQWVSWDELLEEGKAQIADGPAYQGRKLFSPIVELFKQRPNVRI